MVFYFTSNISDPPTTLFMGRDKYENEDLIKWGWPEDVWFHVDKVELKLNLSYLVALNDLCNRYPVLMFTSD